MENIQNTKGPCPCVHHKVIPFLIVVFGATFLLGFWGLLTWDTVNFIWPVIVIAIGAMKMVEKAGVCKCCNQTCHCC